MIGRRPRARGVNDTTERGIIAPADWRRGRIRWSMLGLQGTVLLVLLFIGLGPLLWMAKAAVTPTQDTLRFPMALWPNGIDLGQLATAWSVTHIDRYLINTVLIAVGSWAIQLIVATTGGYALSVLRPRLGGLVTGLIIATLFVPPIVLLVPLYLTVVNVPIANIRMIDSYWAIWLPAGASAVNVVLVKRFFDNLPREIFEAARVDGAGPLRLFWSIVLPLSRPILGVVSVFAIIGDVEGLPVAPARDPRPGPATVVGQAAEPPVVERTSGCSSPRWRSRASSRSCCSWCSSDCS